MAQIVRGRHLFCRMYGSLSGQELTKFSIISQYKQHFSVQVDTTNLSRLRKMTGYGLSLCREALVENKNDVDHAMEWLNEQGKIRGLQKAEKLQGRETSEGLVGVLVEQNHAAMVEVCCETDFVSQNHAFQQLVAKTTATALAHRKRIVQKALDLGGSSTHLREVLLTHKLNAMKVPHPYSGTVNDTILEMIGRLGERITLRRAITMTTDTSSTLGYYTHGPFTYNVDGCSMGKYAGIVALRPKDAANPDQDTGLATKLAQHVVGMGPSVISLADAGGDGVDKNDVLLEQPYLMNDVMTVQELVKKNRVTVVDFLRVVCGEE